MPQGQVDWSEESEKDPGRLQEGTYVFLIERAQVVVDGEKEAFRYWLRAEGDENKDSDDVMVSFYVQNPTKPKGQAMARREFKEFAKCAGRPDVKNAKDLESWNVKAKLTWDPDWPRFRWLMPDSEGASGGGDIPF